MILLLLILLYIFLRWFFKVSEGNIVLIFANIGAGKTTLLSRYAQRELKLIKKGKSKFKHVISNTPISGTIFVKDIRKLLQTTTPEYTYILVDEAGTIWNNRKMKITDEEIEYFKLIRHYHSKLIAISQSYDDIDITLRRLYTSMYMINKILTITLIRPIKKYVTIDKETEQIIDGYVFKNIFSWGILYRPKYYNYFDSWYKPEGSRKPNFKEYKLIDYNKSKLQILIIVLAYTITSYNHKILILFKNTIGYIKHLHKYMLNVIQKNRCPGISSRNDVLHQKMEITE